MDTLDRAHQLILNQLDGQLIGHRPPSEHHDPDRLDLPEVEPQRPIKPCVLCGAPSIWRTRSKGAPVHEPCMADYLRSRQ